MKNLVMGLFLAALAACAVDGGETGEAIGSDESALNVTKGYFLARQDFRKCASPMCGGFFVRHLNRETMKCVDGSIASECYVGKANLSSLGFDAGAQQQFASQFGQGLLIVKGNLSDNQAFGQLNASAVYEAWTDQAADGTFQELIPTGIMCITTPCPTMSAKPLNFDVQANNVTDLNFDALNVAEETKQDIAMLAYEGHLLAAGHLAMKPGAGTVFVASQVYARRFPKIVDQFVGQWAFSQPAPDRSRVTYFFEADGTFTAMNQPGCVFAPKEEDRCAVKLAMLAGNWNLNYDSTALDIVYTDAIRNGETAVFAVEGAGNSRRLIGFDFGNNQKLKKQ